MKRIHCGIIVVVVWLMTLGTLAAYDFEYDAGNIEGSKTSTGITYTLSVSKGNLGTSYDFDTRAGVTSGSPSGIDIDVTQNGATGTVIYANNSLPSSNFTISMNGKLIPPSGGSGGRQPTWCASGEAKAPFHIKSNQNDGAKEIVVPAGTSVTYTAYEGTSSKASNWTVNNQTKNNESSIIFNRNWWDVPGWFSASMGTPDPGIYNISASPTDRPGVSDSGGMSVVGVGEIKAKFQNGDYNSVNGTLFVLSGTNLTVKAYPNPNVVWPENTPTWRTVGDGWFSSRVTSSAGDEKTIDTSETEEEFDIVAICGTHEVKITVTIFTIEITDMAFFGSSSNCYQLKTNSSGSIINVPEVTSAGGEKKVLWGANKDISVKARMITNPAITVSGVKIKSDVAGYPINELLEANVSFNNGVSSGSRIGSVDGFVTFNSKNKTKNTIGKDTVSFAWKSVDVCGKPLTTPINLNTISGINIYTIWDTPKGPWNNNPAWINALDFAITTCNANGKNDTGALAAITDFLHGSHGMSYDTNNGACSYTTSGAADIMNLSGYINKQHGIIVNCYDQAAAVASIGNLLGLDSKYTFLQPFGYINTVNLVGIGNCNNPFYNTLSAPYNVKIVGSDFVEPQRTYFNNHAYVLYAGKVYDACSGPATGTQTENQYLNSIIDRSTPNEEAAAEIDAHGIQHYVPYVY